MKFTNIKRFILFSLIMFQCLYQTDILNAQEKDTREKGLYFNYVGITIGGGINQIEYNDWFTDKRESKDISGNYYSGGFIIDIFVNAFVGEFSIQYISNSCDEEEASVQHLLFSTIGKYSFNLSDNIAIAPGLGLYMETPPSDKKYNGGGGIIGTIGAFINIGRDYKIIFDIVGSYGYFGMGEESTKISYGSKIGIIYNIGRL